MKRIWRGKKVLILGLSKSGISAAKYLNLQGADCYITESRQANEKDLQTMENLQKEGIFVEMGGHSQEFIEDSYIAITSPSVPLNSEIMQKLREEKIQVISEIELAYLESSTPFVVITGTNGKTTTTYLTSHILSAEYKAPFCGNVGIPVCNLLEEKTDYFVCEMSSFQLEYTPTLQSQIAMFLTFTPDHINWHGSLENYFNAKTSIFKGSRKPAFAIFNACDETIFEFGKNYKNEKYFFGKEFEKNCCYLKDDAIYFKKDIEEKIIDLQDVQLVGEHNYQNIMASVIAAKIVGLSNEIIKQQIASFEAPEHRCEYTATINGIKFYNDSKATNPEASIVAIKAFVDKNLTLIAGGRDKNTDLTEFCKYVNNHAKTVILIGEATQRFEENLIKNGFSNIIKLNSMEEAIDKAIEINSEIVLLSPACASFDMYDNFEQRGEHFKNYVQSKKI